MGVGFLDPIPLILIKMVQFNELRFLAPGALQIDVSVIDLPYYDNVFIDSIIIDTEDTYCDTGPSSNPALIYPAGGTDTKFVNTLLDVADILCNGPKMLFVWVTTIGNPSGDVPCGEDVPFKVKAVVDPKDIYNEAMRKLKCTSGSCGCGQSKCIVDANLANFSLQYLRMQTALSVEDWTTAYEAYCSLLRKRPSKRITGKSRKPCGCNG